MAYIFRCNHCSIEHKVKHHTRTKNGFTILRGDYEATCKCGRQMCKLCFKDGGGRCDYCQKDMK